MTVAVLLSSYNGAPYLEEQLASLSAQTHRDFVVVIRDDGSTDETAKIIRNYGTADPRFRYKFGANIGAVASYFQLIEEVGGEFEYCAFCDQDDVWNEDKLERAVARLSQAPDVPSMYFSALDVVDDKLQHLFLTSPPRRALRLSNAAVENIATGCSVVINRRLLALLQASPPRTSHVFMHDWWIYLIASAVGVVIYDPNPGLLYRQHRGNVVGLKSGIYKIFRGVKNLRSPQRGPRISTQLNEFARLFGDRVSPDDWAVIKDLRENAADARLARRLRSLIGRKYYRQSVVNEFGLAFSILLNRI